MYTADNINSFFDKPDRSSENSIENDKEILFNNKLVIKLLDGLPNAALLLNKNRQIVAYNKSTLNLIANGELKSIYGQRVGEAIGCIHAFEMPAGCGTSKFCAECGAGQCNKKTSETLLDAKQECRVTVNKNSTEVSLDLKVGTSIIELDENQYILFAIEDIQNEKRRKVLERFFFHDILNTANSVLGLSDIIKSSESLDEINELTSLMYNSSEQLVKEIQSQRDLINAEEGTLTINNVNVKVDEIINTAFDIYKNHKLAKNKNYYCLPSKQEDELITDKVLLVRCLGNLIKNALEAADEGGTVRVFATVFKDKIRFSVYNDKVIPEKIQLQIFQRSFSTKAASGRGIGTYSVKLLVENYLKGKVFFTSDPEIKTVFSIELDKTV